MNWPLHEWMPLAFLALMGLAAFAYVVLDGFDLGVGLLTPLAAPGDRDLMIASIGPFWDANETWLVLAVGILLVAFPSAHGQILSALYLPVLVLLIGLTLRGVAFEFRSKGNPEHRERWDRTFFAGSLIATLSQGYMLGLYVLGLQTNWAAQGFALLVALCFVAAYGLIGACWLLAKTEHELHDRARDWAYRSLFGATIGIVLISVATPLVSDRVFSLWFTFPNILAVAPIPLVTAALVYALWQFLKPGHVIAKRFEWMPFALTVVLFTLAFTGLAYSFFPYVVPESLTVWDAAAAEESLFIILIGTLITLPVIIGYTILAYRVFGGKAQLLSY